MKVLPDDGGDTCFASMYAAYETLSDRMKASSRGLLGRARRQSGLQGDLPGHRPQVQLLGPPDRPHPSGQRQEEPVRQSVLHQPDHGCVEGRKHGDPQLPLPARPAIRTSRCASAGRRTRWPSGTTAAPGTRAIWDYFPDTRTGYRVTVAATGRFEVPAERRLSSSARPAASARRSARACAAATA